MYRYRSIDTDMLQDCEPGRSTGLCVLLHSYNRNVGSCDIYTYVHVRVNYFYVSVAFLTIFANTAGAVAYVGTYLYIDKRMAGV